MRFCMIGILMLVIGCTDNGATTTIRYYWLGVDLKNSKGGCECACKQYYLP